MVDRIRGESGIRDIPDMFRVSLLSDILTPESVKPRGVNPEPYGEAEEASQGKYRLSKAQPFVKQDCRPARGPFTEMPYMHGNRFSVQ